MQCLCANIMPLVNPNCNYSIIVFVVFNMHILVVKSNKSHRSHFLALGHFYYIQIRLNGQRVQLFPGPNAATPTEFQFSFDGPITTASWHSRCLVSATPNANIKILYICWWNRLGLLAGPCSPILMLSIRNWNRFVRSRLALAKTKTRHQ